MQFKEGATVQTADGEKVGEIVRVVLEPSTQEVTHVVVQKGFLLPEDKVIPVDAFSEADEENATLKSGFDPNEFPRFEEREYIPLGDRAREKYYPQAGYAAPHYWYPSYGATWWAPPAYAGYLPYEPPHLVKVERNIPEGTVPLKEGARVITSDGEHVGDVARVVADSESDRATHFLITQGLIFTDEKLVPTAWVKEVGTDEVHLAVSQDVLEDVPEYEGE
jgi:uncharacterized protein YrrD